VTRLVVFGATGGTGQQLIEQGLQHHHEMLGFARRPPSVPERERLSWIEGDVLDKARVAEAVKGQDAVLCAIGTPNQPGTHVLSQGTVNIVAGMRAAGVRRLVCQTTLGVAESRDQAGFIYLHVIVPLAQRHTFEDKHRQERIVRESGLDWTIVRPSRLTNGPRTGAYRTGARLRLNSLTAHVSRGDVADFMLKQVAADTLVGQAVGISY
jgi:putative NADH-flavin reductase